MGLRHHAAALPKFIKVDISKVTDWQRRAARLSIAVVTFGILGHCVQFPPEHHVFASNFRQSCNWAAITCIVVTAPLIGKVAQVAFDRLLGTMVGGLIGCLCFTAGFHMFGEIGSGLFISFMSGATVWATTYLAFRHALEQLARFVQLTYVIVAFGAKPDKGAFLLALVRVGGIFIGGLFSVLLAVVVLPRSASVESLREMRKALKELYDLNREVWALSGVAAGSSGHRRSSIRKPHRHGYSALQLRLDSTLVGRGAASEPVLGPRPPIGAAINSHDPGTRTATGAGPLRPIASDSNLPNGNGNGDGNHHSAEGRGGGGDGGGNSSGRLASGVSLPRGPPHVDSAEQLGLLVQCDAERDSRQARVEKLFTSVYATLARVDENLAASKGEIYVWHFWGRYFFLPGVHWFPVAGRWRVPRKDLEAMATCLRRVARMLWTLLLDFEEGFGSEMEEVLQLYYPKQLLSELATYQALAIADLLSSFPSRSTIEVDNLFTLGQLTDCLMQISDARSRNAVFKTKRRRARTAEGSLRAAPRGPAPAPAPAPTAVFGAGTEARPGPGPGLSTEAEMAPADGWRNGRAPGPGAADDTVATAADRSLEKVPLLARQQMQPSTAQDTASPGASASASSAGGAPAKRLSACGGGGGGSRSLLTHLSSGLGGALVAGSGSSKGGGSCSGAGDAAGSGAGGGAFISRLLSGYAGSHVALHVTPRKFLQERMMSRDSEGLGIMGSEGGREGSRGGGVAPGPAAGAAAPPPPPLRPGNSGRAREEGPAPPPEDKEARTASRDGTTARTESIDIFGDPRFEDTSEHGGREATAAAGASAADPRLPLVRQLEGGPPPPQAPPGRPTPGPAAGAAAAASLSVVESPPEATGVRGSVTGLLSDRRKSDSPTVRERAAGPTAAAAGAAPAAAATANAASFGGPAPTVSPFGLFAGPLQGLVGRSSVDAVDSARAPSSATGREAAPGADLGFAAFSSAYPPDALPWALSGLSSMLSGLLVEPVTFPPTEEGYLSQVRWYSFQFVMDEMVNELEEAFAACLAVLQQLPYPIT